MRPRRKIAAYTHPPEVGTREAPDTAIGSYYVSVRDGKRHALLAGPYFNHAEALAMVPAARALAQELDPRAWWYAYGTCRMAIVFVAPGALNARLGVNA